MPDNINPTIALESLPGFSDGLSCFSYISATMRVTASVRGWMAERGTKPPFVSKAYKDGFRLNLTFVTAGVMIKGRPRLRP
jgi:hypothetical protein